MTYNIATTYLRDEVWHCFLAGKVHTDDEFKGLLKVQLIRRDGKPVDPSELANRCFRRGFYEYRIFAVMETSGPNAITYCEWRPALTANPQV